MGLQRVLGLGSDETAWTWLHTLRRARAGAAHWRHRDRRDRCGWPGRGYARPGDRDEGSRRRGDRETGSRYRAHPSAPNQDGSAKSLRQFIRETIEPGATIQTDGWRGDAGLADTGDPHRITVSSAGLEQAHEVMPRVPTVVALLTRWLLGTLHGGIPYQHLDDSLDAFTFRFHRRRAPARGLLFHRLAQQAVAVWPAPCHVIISGPRPLLG